MYKLIKGFQNSIGLIKNKEDGSLMAIPMDEANTDYQTFKKEVLAGAELQDATGNVMTQEQANQFVASLP
jgi:hypothetical protein